MRALLASCAAGLVLVASACGGGGGGALPGGADAAPASASAFIAINTDFSSEQWRRATALFAKFSGSSDLLKRVERALRKENVDFERDVKPAVGPEVDVVFLDFANGGNDVVGMTQPKDKAKFEALLKKGTTPGFATEVQGWTVFADSQAKLDRFKRARENGSLADERAFKDAVGKLDESSAVRAYVRGRDVQTALDAALVRSGAPPNLTHAIGTLESIAASASAEPAGVRLDGGLGIEPALKPELFAATLASQLPSGALLYAALNRLDRPLDAVLALVAKSNPKFESQLGQVEAVLGLSVERDIDPLLRSESALAVYPATPIPAIVYLLKISDEDKVRSLLDRLTAIARFAGGTKTSTHEMGGVQIQELQFVKQGFSLFTAVFNGKLLVTNRHDAARAAIEGGERLSADPLYQQARRDAAVPDQTAGFVYLNLRDGLPAAYAFAERRGSVVPQVARENTKPLETALLYAVPDGNRLRTAGFVTIK